MSSVKLNNAEYSEIQTHINKAKLLVEEAMEGVWGTNFDNIYAWVFTENLINDLYSDAESNYKLIFGGGSALICGCGSAIAGTAAAGVGVGATVASVAVSSGFAYTSAFVTIPAVRSATGSSD